jgi:hypothetical protein
MVFEDEEGSEIEQGSPNHSLKWGEYFGRHHGGDGIRGIMEAVDIVEYQRKRDDRYEETHVGQEVKRT